MRLQIAAAGLAVALVGASCGKASVTDTSTGAKTGSSTDPVDAGRADAGIDDPPDAAAGDAGVGAPDAGAPIQLPTTAGWSFYGAAAGGPQHAFGVSADEGGNVWVAGGEEGLFLLRRGASTLQRFTIADGLHPFGYPRPDQGTVTRIYLNVSAVAGGPAGTVFVGYVGMPPGPGAFGCEDNWDGPSPDPNIYKSGDADRVSLAGSGIRVVHYDISSGLDFVAAEPRGREKLCTVHRIAYDATFQNLWFGANHGYAWGDPAYAGDPTCFGQPACSGVREHAHPLLNGYAKEDSTSEVALTNDYWGLAPGPAGALWVGGLFRSMLCQAGTRGEGFWGCEAQGSLPKYFVDWWPDPVALDSRPSGRVDDVVSGMALGPDGSLWIGSFTNGLAHLVPSGAVSYVTSGLVDPTQVTAVKVDPLDGSVWIGAGSGGLTRLQGGQRVPYGAAVFGALASDSIPDIQVDASSGQRRILVAFRAGAIGIYDGP